MTKDPVCGMHVDEARAGAKAEYRGQILYFCSTDCRKEFQSNPELWQPAFESACPAGEVARKEGKALGRRDGTI